MKCTLILILPNEKVMERCVKCFFIPQKRFHLGMRAGKNISLRHMQLQEGQSGHKMLFGMKGMQILMFVHSTEW